MPEVRILICQTQITNDLATALIGLVKRIVSGHDEPGREYVFNKGDVWVHIVPTYNAEHISVSWCAHEKTQRTEEWVTEISRRLAEKIAELLWQHNCGVKAGTHVNVDGALLPADKMTGAATV